MVLFNGLQDEAVSAVTNRFYAEHGSVYERFGPRGRAACREDLSYHLEFVRPVLEFGLVAPMVDYLCWLDAVLTMRNIPAEHLALSLDWLGDFFVSRLDEAEGTIVRDAFASARDEYVRTRGGISQALSPPEPWPEAATFESALLDGQQMSAMAVVNECLGRGCDLVAIEMHVIQPALYSIGLKWQTNQVTVAQEHLATAIAQTVMTMGLLRSQAGETNSKRVLLACVEKNIHSVGLRMVADAFQLAGWDVQYLGANVPTHALLRHVADWKPHLLALSVSFAQQLRVVKEIAAKLCDFETNRPRLIVGGLAIKQFDKLAAMMGADSYCPDPSSAVSYAETIQPF